VELVEQKLMKQFQTGQSLCHLSVCLIAYHFEYVAMNTEGLQNQIHYSKSFVKKKKSQSKLPIPKVLNIFGIMK